MISRSDDRLTRGLDIFIVSAALLIIWPLLGALAGLIWLPDQGPVLVSDARVGRGGASFACWRYRTRSMVKPPSTDLRQAGQRFAVSSVSGDDARITSIGRHLLGSSLDQLPQLINVLRGDMSLVGPKPLRHEEVALYGQGLSAYLALRPGMTGLWRIRRLSEPTYGERMRMDEHFAQHRSVGLYLKILGATIPAVLARRGWY